MTSWPILSVVTFLPIVGAILNHVSPCWSPPSFAANAKELSVLINVDLNQDGTLAAVTHQAIAMTSRFEDFSRNDTGWSARAGAKGSALAACSSSSAPRGVISSMRLCDQTSEIGCFRPGNQLHHHAAPGQR